MKLRPLTRWSALAAVLAMVILIGFALSRSTSRWQAMAFP